MICWKEANYGLTSTSRSSLYAKLTNWIFMSYGQYPFWLKNQADNASASASHSRYEAENAKKTAQELEEKYSKCMKKLADISNEISKYQTSKTKAEMKSILENIKKIILNV